MCCRGLTDLGDVMLCPKKKNLHESCRMGRRIVMVKLICSLGHCECDCHTVHKLSQRRLTADWLAPAESDCSWMCSKVSSDWMPIYIKVKRPALEIFKMDGYFPDSPRTFLKLLRLYNFILHISCFNVIRLVIVIRSPTDCYCFFLCMVFIFSCLNGPSTGRNM
jgi:hypothetical protein